MSVEFSLQMLHVFVYPPLDEIKSWGQNLTHNERTTHTIHQVMTSVPNMNEMNAFDVV